MELGKRERQVTGKEALEEKQTVRYVEKCSYYFFDLVIRRKVK